MNQSTRKFRAELKAKPLIKNRTIRIIMRLTPMYVKPYSLELETERNKDLCQY